MLKSSAANELALLLNLSRVSGYRAAAGKISSADETRPVPFGGAQLRLVDAAYILPIGAPGSSDHVRNWIALAPTYHRAFDAGLIYLNELRRMMLNNAQLRALESLNLGGGVEVFRARLGEQIFLPPDPPQRSTPEFIRLAYRFRQVPA
jgi:putative restriction endonuclease